MKIHEGCAICQSTWGDYWAEVDGQKMFFCCELCEIEFRNMIEEVKRRTGWKAIDEIEIGGDTRGRECTATLNGKAYRFQIGFNSRGDVNNFREQNVDRSSVMHTGGTL